MTIKEMIAALKDLDESLLVVLAKDEEGNGFKPLTDTWAAPVFKDGKAWDLNDPDEFDAAPDDAVPCVVLWP